MRSLLLAATAFAAIATSAYSQPNPSLESPRYGTWGFDLSGVDPSVRPGDDFYRYANGRWDAATAIPADRTRYGNFDKLSELSENRVRAIVEEAAADKLSDPDAQRIGAAYRSFLDEAQAERLKAKPIASELAEIRAIATKDDFTALMGKSNTSGFSSILPVFISIDGKNPKAYAVMTGTGGLTLPDRDYYLSPLFAPKKAAYQAYVQQVLTLAGWADPAASARAAVDFESRLAEASWTRAERRDRDRTYNPMDPAGLQALTPGFNWSRNLAEAGLSDVTRVIATTNTAFPKFAAIYAETPLPTLKAWQAFKLANAAAPMLDKRFADAHFDFHSKTLAGQPEQRPRWKRAVGFTNDTVGEAVGRTYVARWFPPESKAKMDALVTDIRGAMKARIETLEWMGPETRGKALEKLAKFTVKIGYPTEWRDYSGLQLKPDDVYGNAVRSSTYEWCRNLARLRGPVDKKEWGMTPQRVNAYYNYANNEIVFPAAILQAPFFDPNADPAVNYGGIGGVIGHEISHGFDDQGRKSDGDGVLTDWWTPEDNAKFKVQAERLGAQYGAFEPLPGAKVNGALTMGENIGDMGGLSLALDAYRLSLKGRPAPVIDGLTGDQRVFLGWAQVWRQKSRDDALRQQVVSDPHSPARYRVNGTIRNIEGWYSAFDVKPGAGLYVAPADRVRIW